MQIKYWNIEKPNEMTPWILMTALIQTLRVYRVPMTSPYNCSGGGGLTYCWVRTYGWNRWHPTHPYTSLQLKTYPFHILTICGKVLIFSYLYTLWVEINKGKRNAYSLWMLFVSKMYFLCQLIFVWNKYSYLSTLS